jgi:hypothetical protein
MERAAQSKAIRVRDPRSIRVWLVIAIMLFAAVIVPTIGVPLVIKTGHGMEILTWLRISMPLACVLLLAGVLPNVVLYRRHRSRLSRSGLWLACAALVALIAEFVILWFWPLDNEF